MSAAPLSYASTRGAKCTPYCGVHIGRRDARSEFRRRLAQRRVRGRFAERERIFIPWPTQYSLNVRCKQVTSGRFTTPAVAQLAPVSRHRVKNVPSSSQSLQNVNKLGSNTCVAASVARRQQLNFKNADDISSFWVTDDIQTIATRSATRPKFATDTSVTAVLTPTSCRNTFVLRGTFTGAS